MGGRFRSADPSRIDRMSKLSAQTIADAFALSTARGADLLAQLGDFGVWRGDLSAMRGDEPRDPAQTETDAVPTTSNFSDTLLVVRALELLQPACREALRAAHIDHRQPASSAAVVDTDPEHAQRIAACEERLVEIYESLVKDSPAEMTSVRAASGSRRR